MTERRKPVFNILLKKDSKTDLKIEVFKARLWANRTNQAYCDKFRIRVNGKWIKRPDEKYSFFGKYEIRDMFWRSLKNRDYFN